jgi:hypothetical protein
MILGLNSLSILILASPFMRDSEDAGISICRERTGAVSKTAPVFQDTSKRHFGNSQLSKSLSR